MISEIGYKISSNGIKMCHTDKEKLTSTPLKHFTWCPLAAFLELNYVGKKVLSSLFSVSTFCYNKYVFSAVQSTVGSIGGAVVFVFGYHNNDHLYYVSQYTVILITVSPLTLVNRLGRYEHHWSSVLTPAHGRHPQQRWSKPFLKLHTNVKSSCVKTFIDWASEEKQNKV